MRRRAPGLAVLAALMIVSAGCGAEDAPAAPPQTAAVGAPDTSASPTTTEVVSEDDAVRQAYEDAYVAYFDARESPELDNRLAETRTGPSLSEAETAVAALADAGQRAGLYGGKEPKTTISAVRVDGKSAWVESCDVDESVVIDAGDGTVVRSEPEARKVRSELVHHSTGWKVRSAEVLQSWPGQTSCRDAS